MDELSLQAVMSVEREIASVVEREIASVLAAIPAVESVYVSQRGGLCKVFTVTAEEDEGAFDQIYEQERAIIRLFSDFHFDFNVVARRGRPLHELLTFAEPTSQRTDGDVLCLPVTSI